MPRFVPSAIPTTPAAYGEAGEAWTAPMIPELAALVPMRPALPELSAQNAPEPDVFVNVVVAAAVFAAPTVNGSPVAALVAIGRPRLAAIRPPTAPSAPVRMARRDLRVSTSAVIRKPLRLCIDS
jgi:hypothetical protein